MFLQNLGFCEAVSKFLKNFCSSPDLSSFLLSKTTLKRPKYMKRCSTSIVIFKVLINKKVVFLTSHIGKDVAVFLILYTGKYTRKWFLPNISMVLKHA